MWGHIDEAQKDQALIEAAKTPVRPKENKIGRVWSKNGLIWFMETGTEEKRYVGSLRLKRKTLPPDIYKRLSEGARIIMEYDAEAAEEEKLE